MVSHGLESSARRRASVTGEHYRQALEAIRQSLPGSSMPRWADGDQLLLESMLFSELIRNADYHGYAGMLRRARPTAQGLEITLGTHHLVNEFLGRVLPLINAIQYCEVGVAGLRVSGVDGRGLWLTLHGTTASVLVRGATPAAWRDALRRRTQEVLRDGDIPCWTATGGSLHRDEDTRLASWHSRLADGRDEARLASGLLRRIGVLNATNAFCTNAWFNPGRGGMWIIEFECAPGVDRHGQTVDALLDQHLGLSLRPASIDYHSDDDDAPRMRTLLSAVPPLRGCLQLRFSRCSADLAWGARRHMEERQVPQERLYQIVPPALGPNLALRPL